MTIEMTFSCTRCKIKFQLIGISTKASPNYYPYCGNSTIEISGIILC